MDDDLYGSSFLYACGICIFGNWINETIKYNKHIV